MTTTPSRTAAADRTLRRFYSNAKRDAADALGGDRAYWIVGPKVRRMAVSDAILTVLDQQDDDAVSDAAVRSLLIGLRDLLTSDEDFQ